MTVTLCVNDIFYRSYCLRIWIVDLFRIFLRLSIFGVELGDEDSKEKVFEHLFQALIQIQSNIHYDSDLLLLIPSTLASCIVSITSRGSSSQGVTKEAFRNVFNFTKQLFRHVINRIPALIARQIRFVWTQKLQYKELPHHSLLV